MKTKLQYEQEKIQQQHYNISLVLGGSCSLRAGSRLGFMREMRDASGVSHLAHKTQTRACSQAMGVGWYKPELEAKR